MGNFKKLINQLKEENILISKKMSEHDKTDGNFQKMYGAYYRNWEIIRDLEKTVRKSNK